MASTDVFQTIVACIRGVVPGLEHHRFARTDGFEELGATSVDRAEILTTVMESLSMAIPRVEMYGAKNIGQLEELIHEKLCQR
jgi:polyketide biosynthesis acyl carrier protein